MSHEPTDEEIEAALSKTAAGYSLRNALTAANAIRDKRIRAEALEEAAREADNYFTTKAAVQAIRALKDKTDE